MNWSKETLKKQIQQQDTLVGQSAQQAISAAETDVSGKVDRQLGMDSAEVQKVMEKIPYWLLESDSAGQSINAEHLQDWWLSVSVPCDGRLAGDPVPFRMGTDPSVSSILLFFALLVMLVAARSRHYLVSGLKDFFNTRQRENMFSNYAEARLQGRVFFVMSFCLSLGILFFANMQQFMPEVVDSVSPHLLLGLSVGCCGIGYLVRMLLYRFVNAVFFDRERNLKWVEANALLMVVASLLFLWIALLVVFYELEFQMWVFLFSAISILLELCLIFKTQSIFSEARWNFLHIILYLCTLEFLPILSMWKAMVWGAQELIGFV